MQKNKKIIFSIIFIITTIIIIGWALSDEEVEEDKIIEEKIEEKTPKENKEETKVIIDIKGQVNNPGVYELNSSNNVNDAINMAGGLTNLSDTSNINLSKKLSDEMVIIIYSKEEIQKMKEKEQIKCPEVNDACIKNEDEKAKLIEENEIQDKININTASAQQLQTLKGIGKAKAEAIIEYRDQTPFETIEDIKKVSGIGEEAYEKIKDYIIV